MSTKEEKEKILLEIELRKVKALEKIGTSLDALTIWFEEVDKDEWSGRIQYYLSEFHGKVVKDNEVTIKDNDVDEIYKTDED
jgi:hypothetical protein